MTDSVSELNIRESRIEDAAGIAAVQIASWKSAYSGLLSRTLLSAMDLEEQTWMFGDILRRVDPRKTLRASVLASGKVIGYIAASLEFSADAGLDADSELWGIYIDPFYQSKGIGKVAFDFARDWLKIHNRSRVLIWVAQENLRAQKFYERLGAKHLNVEKVKKFKFGAVEDSLIEVPLFLKI